MGVPRDHPPPVKGHLGGPQPIFPSRAHVQASLAVITSQAASAHLPPKAAGRVPEEAVAQVVTHDGPIQVAARGTMVERPSWAPSPASSTQGEPCPPLPGDKEPGGGEERGGSLQTARRSPEFSRHPPSTGGIEVVDIEARFVHNVDHLHHLGGTREPDDLKGSPPAHPPPAFNRQRVPLILPTHSSRAVHIWVFVEVALPSGAAEALQVVPEPVEEKQGVLSRLWGSSASPSSSQDPSPLRRGSPVPQEAVVVGEVNQGVVVGLVGGEPIAHREALKDTSGDLQQPLTTISLPPLNAQDKRS